ncbi:hypothetical protein K435DRAFT_794623 [Dendrothele bispora CBS 962.96]|uniref:Hydrophobin n=1 Tax=Dendrothele bispora (strain CBS 962.96) TaxID=1314807 RepID=A0A4S8MBG0_DENBC|nr:hypothetical protein K435DRAFT_794623 [Dendrothele bispora CBS 962.96]
MQLKSAVICLSTVPLVLAATFRERQTQCIGIFVPCLPRPGQTPCCSGLSYTNPDVRGLGVVILACNLNSGIRAIIKQSVDWAIASRRGKYGRAIHKRQESYLKKGPQI